MSPSTSTPPPLIAQIEARQAELGMSDEQLGEALGYERGNVIRLIKSGAIKLPLSKVRALAAALELDRTELLRTAIQDAVPEMAAVIEDAYNPMRLTATELTLIKHLRKLSGDVPTKPIVFDGRGVIALVTA
ncbi:MAG: hypothetical protein GZ085_14075 [Sulfuriferula multivorans]|uniref:Helix-turn-helix domain-containing protein n=1 Tax=Sulfuriferula multivorans TaxID=1559896 RepID=A0A7C9TC47_9PROT|nr:hypothetical protein [Sulfuriferula multivorans]